MKKLVDDLHDVWQDLFTLPSGDKANSTVWGMFVFSWLWAIVAAIPGALAAAYIIGRFHIADQRLQDVVSVGLAFVSMVLIQAIILIVVNAGREQMLKVYASAFDQNKSLRSRRALFFLYLALVLPPSILFIFGPFVLAGGAVYWYFTHASASSDVAARGTGGALALKVLLTLINVVVWPAIKAVFLQGFWRWLRGKPPGTPKPDESEKLN